MRFDYVDLFFEKQVFRVFGENELFANLGLFGYGFKL